MSILLFDIDGTLLRGAARGHREALIAGVEQVTNARVSFNGIDTSGRLDGDIVVDLLRSAGRTKAEAERNIQAVREAACIHYLQHEQESLAHYLCPGVPELLRTAHSVAIQIGVVSGNFRSIGRRKLELAGISEYFTFGAFAEDGRTRSALARKAAREGRNNIGLPPDTQATLIGDHANDIQAARANKFRSIAVATGVLDENQLRTYEPDLVVRQLTALNLGDLFVR